MAGVIYGVDAIFYDSLATFLTEYFYVSFTQTPHPGPLLICNPVMVWLESEQEFPGQLRVPAEAMSTPTRDSS